MPDRSFVDPIRLRKWLGELQIIELRSAAKLGKRFFVRLQGGCVASKVGLNLHGRYLEDGLPANTLDTVLFPLLIAIEHGRPSYSVLRNDALPGHFEAYTRLVLPIRDAVSGIITQLVEWTGPTERLAVAGKSIFESTQFPCAPSPTPSEVYLIRRDGSLEEAHRRHCMEAGKS